MRGSSVIVAVAVAAGLLFAAGLAIAGMTQPAKVIGFLDVGGRWDPSLALVMVGAIGVYLPMHRLSRRRARPLWGDSFAEPAASAIDRRLLAGAAIFGVGWGASGYCPGPAATSVARGGAGLLAFLGAMLLGMLVARLTLR